MSDSSPLLLAQVDSSQAAHEVTANQLFDAMSSAAAYGRHAEACAGRTWAWYGVRYGGVAVSNGFEVLTPSTVSYMVANSTTGAVSIATGTTNWNDSATYGRCYKIVAGASTVTSYEDHRFGPGGVFAAAADVASVTSVDITAPAAGITATGGPITTAGSVTLALANDLAAVEGLATTGLVRRTGADTWSAGTAVSLTTEVSGILPIANIATGAPDGSKFVRDDGVLAVPSTAFTGGTLTSALNEAPEVSLASAGSVAIGAAAANSIAITGTTTITAFDSVANGAVRRITFGGALTLTHNAVSLILPGAVNITTAAGDVAELLSLGAGNWRVVAYQRSSGTAVVGGGSTQGRHAIYVAAASMTPSVVNGCAILARLATFAGFPDIVTLDFDTSNQEYAQFSIAMPKSWDEGTITFAPLWSHANAGATHTVVWDLQAVAISNADNIGVTNYGGAQTSTDTGGTGLSLYQGPESAAITIGGTPASEDMVFFRLSRVTANASDTMTIDAKLHGIVVYITTNADTDA